MFEKLVVILPEFALIIRRQRGNRGQRRILMKVEGKVLPDNAYVVAVCLSDLLEGRTDPPAEGSLEVRELGDGDRGSRRALERRAVCLDRVHAVGIGPTALNRPRAGLFDFRRKLGQTSVDLVEPRVEHAVASS